MIIWNWVNISPFIWSIAIQVIENLRKISSFFFFFFFEKLKSENKSRILLQSKGGGRFVKTI